MKQRTGRTLFFALAAVCAVTACGREPTTAPMVGRMVSVGAQHQIEAAVRGRKVRGFEDDILRMESRAPGLGGVSFDSDGSIIVYLTDTSNAEWVRKSLRGMARQLVDPDPNAAAMLAESKIIIRKGRFTFSQLVHLVPAVTRALQPLAGFQAIDADESLNRIRVTVNDPASAWEARRAVAALGLPDSLTTIEIHPRVTSTSIREVFRPVTYGGVQIMSETQQFCSLGFNVVTNLSENGFLTASHCLTGPIGAGFYNQYMYQSYYAPFVLQYRVGTVTINNAFTATEPECGGFTLCTWADVAFIQYSPTSLGASRLARTASPGVNNNGGSISYVSYWGSLIKATAAPGLTIDKVGRSTGWTRGTVAATCENFRPRPGDQYDYMVLCSTRVTGASSGQGDSGAPVFRPHPFLSNVAYTYGIEYAGGPLNTSDHGDRNTLWWYEYCSAAGGGGCFYYYSPWANIETHLGRTFNHY
jgi:hypothetical protein